MIQTHDDADWIAHYRDVVRPRILLTPPIEDTTDKRCEIHALTCVTDWLDLIWALKSFYVASGRKYALCIHDDGSLTDIEFGTLQRHFPASRIIRSAEADIVVTELLRGFPLSAAFRKIHPLARKLFDFTAFLDSGRMAVFDSDLLFFSEPTVFLQRVEDPSYQRNTFNADASGSGYTATTLTEASSDPYTWFTFDPEKVRDQIGHDLMPRVNSGFGLVHRASFNWYWIEEFLALPGIQKALDRNPNSFQSMLQFAMIEQTICALCSSRYGIELLPDEYIVRLEPGLGERCFRHYIGTIRNLMYSEGIPQLLELGFLAKGS